MVKLSWRMWFVASDFVRTSTMARALERVGTECSGPYHHIRTGLVATDAINARGDPLSARLPRLKNM